MRATGSKAVGGQRRLRPAPAILLAAALATLSLLWSLRMAAGAGAPAVASRARVSVVVELDAPPVAEVYSAQAAGETASAASLTTAAQAHLAAVEAAQQALAAPLAAMEARVLYRTQRVYNGIALQIAPERLAELAALPGVRAVHRLAAKTPAQDAPADGAPANATAVPWIGAIAAWQGGGGPGYTGAGITIALIDTGIDYLHRDFGGPGSGYDENDPTRIGDAPNFPGPK
ncbi:MAG TPA: hypothetical protein VNK95_18235, partial [Caldilineaceae bacterium]|nr:hypothetical protein [Caldilineaceae bacterium]